MTSVLPILLRHQVSAQIFFSLTFFSLAAPVPAAAHSTAAAADDDDDDVVDGDEDIPEMPEEEDPV